ncbi:YMGG-like glycine zipper-containing protein [Hyphococcus flavus]|uniref:YMGG-like glycine zipper-containing protein n=1 Tax=Hyphococcus flavus TaxID=1866326 RepID=A0AAE9ZBN2_9PROT|nr:YMGG-like glycine zipper-containing protein [Hyphococcus flavus]WDI31684.1 YMGG-like glycine zipper-containing protein [Hyphococcus flavus]
MKLFVSAAVSSLMFVSACTSSGTAERNAVYGAAAGAAAGAIAGEVIAGRPGKGAAIGAGVGAVGGAIVGCQRAQDCFGRARDNGDRRYDDYAGRYFYVDPRTGDTWWENGEFRSYGPGRP